MTKNENGNEEIFAFPNAINHDCMAEAIQGIRNQSFGNWERIYRKPISAGFIDNYGLCYGKSESLDLKSRPVDSEIFGKQLRNERS